MSTLVTVTITTNRSNINVCADKDLLDFLKTCTARDTHILQNYYGVNIPFGEFYVGCIVKKT